MKNFILPLILLIFFPVYSQEFDASLQLRPRFEYRNGFKTLLSPGEESTSFISQRSRLNLGFINDALQMKLSLQNVRVWGDVPTVTVADRYGVALFEAYAIYKATPYFSVKLGRQVLSYDNQRILGGLDWAQQGQSHDAILLKFLPANNQELQIAIAMNESGEDLVRDPYLVNSYKNLQLAHYQFRFTRSKLSFLMMNTGYEFASTTNNPEVHYMQTFGAYYFLLTPRWLGDIAAYGQTGERNGREVKAFYAGGNINYNFTSSLAAGVGAEYLSGTDFSENPQTNKSFSPLFGTNHGFNGFMDYFYVGNHFNSVGLTDLYGKISYRVKSAELALIPHVFFSPTEIRGLSSQIMDSRFGTEIDIVGTHRIRRDITGSLGYSQMFGSSTLELLKGGDADRVQNWAWVMISFHPELFSIKKEIKDDLK